MSEGHFVYFVRLGDTGHIKIGTSRNVAQRLSKMATDMPSKPEVVLVIRGDRTKELALHKELAAHRKRGEWFDCHPEVMAVIDRERAKAGNVQYIHSKHKLPPKCALQAWRRKSAITTTQLAQLIGTSETTISRLENGKQRPGWDILDALFRLSNGEVTPNDFLRPELFADSARAAA